MTVVADTPAFQSVPSNPWVPAKWRNPSFKNIYSAGVCIALPHVDRTPLPVGAPETGHMIESIVAAAHNIANELSAKEPSEMPI